MNSKYVIQKEEKSFCPDCEGKVSLLTPRFPKPRDVMFYICFRCSRVAEVGRGPVPKV